MKKVIKYVLIVIAGLFVIGILGAIFGDKNKKVETVKSKEVSSSTESELPKSEPISNWTYSEDVDKMTSEKKFYATCTSTNEVEFEFPYQGGSNLTLTIRKLGKKSELLASISKGQIITSIMGDKTCRLKFDDNKPINFTYNSPSDGSSDVVFIENASKFISLLKSSKKIIFELEFFKAGNQQFDFNVAGLKWEK